MIHIVQDTREKKPWIFEDPFIQTVDTVIAGDYILKDYPDLITIDRKQKPSELASNLGMYIDRFERELEKMTSFQYKYILCEFSYDKMLRYPYGCGLPKKTIKKINPIRKKRASLLRLMWMV